MNFPIPLSKLKSNREKNTQCDLCNRLLMVELVLDSKHGKSQIFAPFSIISCRSFRMLGSGRKTLLVVSCGDIANEGRGGGGKCCQKTGKTCSMTKMCFECFCWIEFKRPMINLKNGNWNLSQIWGHLERSSQEFYSIQVFGSAKKIVWNLWNDLSNGLQKSRQQSSLLQAMYETARLPLKFPQHFLNKR